MPKSEENVKRSEDFIKEVLKKNFNQKVKPKELKRAAEKLIAAIPTDKRKPEAQTHV